MVSALTTQQYENMLRENERLRDYAKRATYALIKVRPLGGSELFMRFDENAHYADPEWCGSAIDDLRNSLHETNIELARARKKD